MAFHKATRKAGVPQLPIEHCCTLSRVLRGYARGFHLDALILGSKKTLAVYCIFQLLEWPPEMHHEPRIAQRPGWGEVPQGRWGAVRQGGARCKLITKIDRIGKW